LAGCHEPNPPPTPEVSQLYLVHETGDATPETAVVINDKVWKDKADELGLDWLILDDESGEKLLPDVVKAARDCGLPAVVVCDGREIIETVPLPDLDGMRELVAEKGADQ